MSKVDQLSRLLSREKSLLIAGDLAAVADLVAEKEALAEALEEDNPADLTPVSAQLQENARLLTAAQSGVAQVKEALKQQRAARSSLSSYDEKGAATQIGPTHSGTLRRY